MPRPRLGSARDVLIPGSQHPASATTAAEARSGTRNFRAVLIAASGGRRSSRRGPSGGWAGRAFEATGWILPRLPHLCRMVRAVLSHADNAPADPLLTHSPPATGGCLESVDGEGRGTSFSCVSQAGA